MNAGTYIESINIKKIDPYIVRYLSGIIHYLNSDFKNAFIDFETIIIENKKSEIVHDEILFIVLYCLNDDRLTKRITDLYININPKPEDYLILANLEFKNKNTSKALMLCNQAIKLNKSYPEAYSAMSVLFSLDGNYSVADEMIKNGKKIFKETKLKNNNLYNQMLINETAIALLKNEKERAYILLQTVLSVDSNEKASLLYNRYFNKNEKIQN